MIDFAIVGQPKSGTTALAEFLSDHPDICISVPKEPTYFARDLQRESDDFHGRAAYFEFRTPEAYAATFAHCVPTALRGDASTAYLYSTSAAAEIHDANPATKIIVMLREPVSLMHSLHMQYVNETTEDEHSFAAALAKEQERRQGRSLPSRVRCPSYLFYRERVRYAQQLERFYNVFPPEQICVMTMEEFQQDNEGHYRKVLRFLGVDTAHVASFRTVHGSKAPRSMALNRMLNAPALKRTIFRLLGPRRYTAVSRGVANMAMRPQQREALTPDLERQLREELADEVRSVSRVVGRDLSAVWGY